LDRRLVGCRSGSEHGGKEISLNFDSINWSVAI